MQNKVLRRYFVPPFINIFYLNEEIFFKEESKIIKVKGTPMGIPEGGRVNPRNNPGEVHLRQKGNSHAGIQRNLSHGRGNVSRLDTQKIKYIKQMKLLSSPEKMNTKKEEVTMVICVVQMQLTFAQSNKTASEY